MYTELFFKADWIVENTSVGSSMVFSFSFRAGIAFYCWKWIGSEKRLWLLFINVWFLGILGYVIGLLICRGRKRWCWFWIGFCAINDFIFYYFFLRRILNLLMIWYFPRIFWDSSIHLHSSNSLLTFSFSGFKSLEIIYHNSTFPKSRNFASAAIRRSLMINEVPIYNELSRFPSPPLKDRSYGFYDRRNTLEKVSANELESVKEQEDIITDRETRWKLGRFRI